VTPPIGPSCRLSDFSLVAGHVTLGETVFFSGFDPNWVVCS